MLVMKELNFPFYFVECSIFHCFRFRDRSLILLRASCYENHEIALQLLAHFRIAFKLFQDLLIY